MQNQEAEHANCYLLHPINILDVHAGDTRVNHSDDRGTNPWFPCRDVRRTQHSGTTLRNPDKFLHPLDCK